MPTPDQAALRIAIVGERFTGTSAAVLAVRLGRQPLVHIGRSQRAVKAGYNWRTKKLTARARTARARATSGASVTRGTTPVAK